MNKKIVAAALAASMLAAASPASAAQYMLNFTTNQTLFGGVQTGNATIVTSDTLTTSPLGLMGFAVTSITGLLNGSAITGLSGSKVRTISTTHPVALLMAAVLASRPQAAPMPASISQVPRSVISSPPPTRSRAAM